MEDNESHVIAELTKMCYFSHAYEIHSMGLLFHTPMMKIQVGPKDFLSVVNNRKSLTSFKKQIQPARAKDMVDFFFPQPTFSLLVAVALIPLGEN